MCRTRAARLAASGGLLFNEFIDSSSNNKALEIYKLPTPPGTDLPATACSRSKAMRLRAERPRLAIVDESLHFRPPTCPDGLVLSLPADALENGTLSLLLISGTFPAPASDIDANNDGVIDDGLGFTVVDAVAVNDGGTSTSLTEVSTLGVAYDGAPFAPGGASRIPDGTDTDTTADWVRNDFDLAGIPTSQARSSKARP